MSVYVCWGVMRKSAHTSSGIQEVNGVVGEETDQGCGEKISADQLNQSCGLCRRHTHAHPPTPPVSFPVSISARLCSIYSNSFAFFSNLDYFS